MISSPTCPTGSAASCNARRFLFDEFKEALKRKLSDKARRGRILNLILFGSYARGDWVEDRKSGYLSDYDLLVIVNEERFGEQHESWEKAAERFVQELTITRQLATPVNFIVHTYQDVNTQLAQGRPFFVDIARDGIVLYEAPGSPSPLPRPSRQTKRAPKREKAWIRGVGPRPSDLERNQPPEGDPRC